MKAKNLLVLAAAVFVAGCPMLPLDRAANPIICNPGLCEVTVTITDCFAWDGIKVDGDPIVVRQRQNIRWTINTEGYTFTADGVVINWDPGRTFRDPIRQGKTFQWHDTYEVKDRFKYTINVQNKHGVKCRPFDPWINNE